MFSVAGGYVQQITLYPSYHVTQHNTALSPDLGSSASCNEWQKPGFSELNSHSHVKVFALAGLTIIIICSSVGLEFQYCRNFLLSPLNKH